jgi:carboxylesterase
LVWPVNTNGLTSKANPVGNYDTACKKLAEWKSKEDGFQLHDVCRTKLMTHGYRVENVIIILHGYTTCPEQFAELGKRFFDLGFNVFIPCLDYHGREDRLTDVIQDLTAERMVSFGDQMLDIATGLGEKVTVLGISGGGTITAWLAQNRSDVYCAVPLAAFIRVGFLPAFLTTPFIRIFSTLPHFFIWWDPRTKANNPYSIFYAYPRYSLRNFAQIMRLGLAVKRQSQIRPPAAGHIMMIINDFDPGVSNTELNSLYEVWKSQKGEKVTSYHFDKEMKMLHDIITPGTPGIPIEDVYSRIIQQVTLRLNPVNHIPEKII